jgi:hypothetical protein
MPMPTTHISKTEAITREGSTVGNTRMSTTMTSTTIKERLLLDSINKDSKDSVEVILKRIPKPLVISP